MSLNAQSAKRQRPVAAIPSHYSGNKMPEVKADNVIMDAAMTNQEEFETKISLSKVKANKTDPVCSRMESRQKPLCH